MTEEQRIQCAVNKLPPAQRLLLIEHVGGLTYKQIAQLHHLSCRKTVRLLARAYAELRVRLGDL